MNRARKAGDREAVAAIKAEAGNLATLGDEAKAMRQAMTEIRKNEVRIIESDKYTDAQKNTALRNWNHKRVQAVDKFNKAVNRATVREREAATD